MKRKLPQVFEASNRTSAKLSSSTLSVTEGPRKKAGTKPYLFLCYMLVTAVLSTTLSFADGINEGSLVKAAYAAVKADAVPAKKPVVGAGAAILMDMKSGRVLYEKNARSRRAMASTTKIMTCILAIEKGNLNDTVEISKRAASVWGSTIDLKVGQKLTLKELLYGLMLNSGNDAAIAVAEHIGGTVEDFAQMMTEKAQEIGAKDTAFKTPHGLDADGHYTTAYDLALITRYALNNPTFCQIVRTKSTSISIRGLYNTNEMLDLYPGADGVKTGYTGQAGRCLVTSATRNNWRIISVVLNCPTVSVRSKSSKDILDYGFNYFKPYTLVDAGEHIKDIDVIKGTSGTVALRADETINLPLSEEEIRSIKRVYELPQSLPAPVNANTEVGKVKFMLNGQELASCSIKTGEDIARKGVINYLEDILLKWQRIMREGLQFKL